MWNVRGHERERERERGVCESVSVLLMMQSSSRDQMLQEKEGHVRDTRWSSGCWCVAGTGSAGQMLLSVVCVSLSSSSREKIVAWMRQQQDVGRQHWRGAQAAAGLLLEKRNVRLHWLPADDSLPSHSFRLLQQPALTVTPSPLILIITILQPCTHSCLSSTACVRAPGDQCIHLSLHPDPHSHPHYCATCT